MLDRLIILLWASAMGFVCTVIVGTTHIMSSMVPYAILGYSVDILLIFLTALYAGLIWRFVPLPQSFYMKMAALLPPLCLFIYCLS